MSRRLPFTSPWLLAPMEGVTEPCFRGLVLARNAAHELGGAFTEFVRVVDQALPRRVLRAHLASGDDELDTSSSRPFSAENRLGCTAAPVGIQLMGSNVTALAETARRAVEVGAPVVDLNFGCPAKGALRGCAGSALLREPRELERIVRACVDTVGDVPLTGKIRAGYDDDRLLEDLARAVEAGGASMLTVHCRTRAEAYCETVDWTRIARAVSSVTIPVCGNGGVGTHVDLQRMRDETGCALVMVGRAALGDPWIFSGRGVDRAEAARFLVEYSDRLLASGDAGVKGAAARVKQLLNHWTAGGLVDDGSRTRESTSGDARAGPAHGEHGRGEDVRSGDPPDAGARNVDQHGARSFDRVGWLRERDPAALLERLRDLAGTPPDARAIRSAAGGAVLAGRATA